MHDVAIIHVHLFAGGGSLHEHACDERGLITTTTKRAAYEEARARGQLLRWYFSDLPKDSQARLRWADISADVRSLAGAPNQGARRAPALQESMS